ncbi:ATP-binding cassette sub-family A member 1 [Hypsibius exemplaris]|uniref:ATP-binding cassette sub-family A member 1 n=1 Tax=Hypsibius exemplaris TaxID=2072580 RepID=A0A1W0WKL5_HYPEX|nr:ATP-binding cassette sub-family A member 1 [Hypsibius exemplaris]
MHFGKQLRLLLWKNWTLRKRQPIRFVIEITWPIVLLALLALVRTRNLQSTIPECHFDEKALPSAGTLPMLQSYICAFNNTCRTNSSDTAHGSVNMYHDSIVSQIFQILERVFENKTLQDSMSDTVENAVHLLRIGQELANGFQLIPQSNLRFRDLFSLTPSDFPESVRLAAEKRKNETGLPDNIIDGLLDAQFRPFLAADILESITGNQLFCDLSRFNKVFLFNNTVNVTELSGILCPVPASAWFLLLGPATNYTRLTSSFKKDGAMDPMFLFNLLRARSAFSDLTTAAKKLTPFRSALTDIQSAYTSSNSSGLKFVGRFVCGSHAGIFDINDKLQMGGNKNPLQQLRESTLTGNSAQMSTRTAERAMRSNVSSEYCKHIFDYFEKNTQVAIRFLWKPLKSFVLGKLLYTPDTPLTRRIVKRMNQTFESLDSLIWSGKQIAKLLPELQIVLDAITSQNFSGNNSGMVDFFQTLTGLLQSQGLGGLIPTGLSSGAFAGLQANATSIAELKEQIAMMGSFISNVTRFMSCFDLNKFVPMANEAVLNKHGAVLVDNGTFWSGIVFDNLKDDAYKTTEEIPPFIRYKIRYDIDKVDSTVRVQDRFWRPHPRRQPLSDLKYWTYGFSQLQDMIERALMGEILNSSKPLPGLYLQQFPYPCYIEDTFFMAISRNFPLIMTIAWVYTAAMMVKSIVYEKEKRLKETMMMMGLSSGANWFAWFVETFVTMHISIIFMVIILVYGNVLMHSNWFLIYIFLLAFCLSTIGFGFFLSVFFSKANIAAAAGGILFFTSFMPYSLLILWEDRLTLAMKITSCLLPNVAFGWGSNVFARREEQGVGVQFKNVGQAALEGDTFNLLHSIFMLFVDALLLFLFSWYLEAVMPGQYGIPRPWYFPATSAYWFGTNRKKSRQDEEESQDVNTKPDTDSNFEPEPSHATKGVQIRNLRKVYHNGKVALEGLSLNVYEGITSLLGHNGAGKTTTFSILCGLFPASSGTAKIYGYDVQTEMDRIRESFGFCPQHNVLWDELTVEEHLRFYASLKMMGEAAIKREIDIMIEHVGLPNKRHEKAKNLSGGMQRKLSVAIAYIGGAKVVLLDEPTAGVDPWARRGIWNLLIRFRKDRTTIMSTHFHGEADTLSDRIAVIADGKLICGGSPVFLKSRFGNGYYLTLVKSNALTSEEDIRRFIHSYVPEALLVENVGSELAYVLPTASNTPGNFAALFEGLDANMGFLEISSYGVRDTSLEEVFLRVMEKHDQNKPPEDDVATQLTEGGFLAKTRRRMGKAPPPPAADGPLDNSLPFTSSGGNIVAPVLDDWDQIGLAVKRVHGKALLWQQMKALHIKRFHNMRRSKKSFACEILLPAVFVCIAMLVTLLTPVPVEQPPLELTPWLYGPPNYIFFSNDRPNETEPANMVRNLYEGPGLGTRCMKGSPVTGKSCSSIKMDLSQLIPTFNVSANATPSCTCSTGGQDCPAEAGGPMPPCMLLNTTDWLCNMTGRNISDWLTKTATQYDATRYGGFSFGEVDSYARYNFTRWAEVIQTMFNNANLTGTKPSKDRLSGRWQDFIHLLTGMFQRDNVKVWFNNRGWASSPSYMNAANNVILRSHLKTGTDPSLYGILAINHPLSRTEEQMDDQIMKESAKSLLHAVCVIFAMSFVPASFVMFLIEERVSGAKNLQFTAKVKPWLYWVSTYMWDIGNYLLTTVICLLIFLAFNEKAYVSATNAPALVALLALYGFAAIPMMYIPSFYFKVPSSAFVALACFNLFLGTVSTITVFILELLQDEELQEIAAILRKVFLVLPHYCLGRGLMDLAITQVKTDIYSRFGQDIEDRPFEWSYMGRNVFCMCIQGVLFFALTLLIEYNFFWKTKKHLAPSGALTAEDRDVAQERLRVLSGQADASVLKVRDLTKTFRQRKRVHTAVDKVSFAIGKGECFGLLGVNGAGKTTTFKMLTGNLTPTTGDAFVNDHSVVSDLDRARQHVGYCPQFDAINELLTGREHLQFYARIHGIPEKYVRKAADRGIHRLQLSAYANRSAGGYSGGNKRKLSTAIALIGDPDIVFLDEPTTGMDPKARRFLWNCILSMIREGRSVTLTSHSLEECENLCTKLAIMVNGRFQCFGSLQHLKSRFGFGYSVVIRCAPESMHQVCAFMEETFRGARLQEKHYNTVQYRIPLRGVRLSHIFSAIERNREALLIEDSSVNQTNLEDIFIEFAKHQTDLATDEFLPEAHESPLHDLLPGNVDTTTFDSISMADSATPSRTSTPDLRDTLNRQHDFQGSTEQLVEESDSSV